MSKNKKSLFAAMFFLVMVMCPTFIFANLNPYSRVRAENFNASNGIKKEAGKDGGSFVNEIENNDWIMFKNVDFGTGATKANFGVATYTKGGTLEVRIGGTNGRLVGSVVVPNTHGKDNWQTVTCNISGATGVQDVYFVFKGEGKFMFNINWFEFIKAAVVTTPVPTQAPGQVNAFSNMYAKNAKQSYGTKLENCSEGGQNIGYIENGDWIKFSNVAFGDGASKAEFRVASDTNGGKVEVRVGGVNGTLVGTATVGKTNGWQNWQTVSCNVNGLNGNKDIYLVFKGGSGYLFNMNWVKFSANSATPTPTPAPTQKTIVYQVVQGHDGDPDPDDNGAALAGHMAIKNNIARNPGRVEFLGFVYGDTTERRQNSMINGGGDSYNGSNGYANYKFYKQYTVPALKSVGCNVFYDTTTQTYNFNAYNMSQMTTSGQFLTKAVQNAIDNSNASKELRVVYSAGGGVNVPAETIKYLKNKGYSDSAIKDHFLVVQHSKWNYESASEKTAQNIVRPFYVAIKDQNAYTGHNQGVPTSVSATKTSPVFANAWAVAVGGQKPNPAIPGFGSIDDVSDSGSHSYSSNPSVLDKNWYTRNNGFDNNRVEYSAYKGWNIKEELCD